MKPTTLLASSALALATALTALSWLKEKPGDHDAATANSDPKSFQLSTRPADTLGNSSTSTTSKKFTDRDTPRPRASDSAEAKLQALLTPEQQAQLEAARQHTNPDDPSVARRAARDQAITKLRADLRTAILTNPDNWTETYAALHQDFQERFPSPYATSSSTTTGSDTPSSPETPDAT
ncbi:MAG: hypothetical protein ACQKBU_02445, partial [Verrucomicrobiales bacterium]